MDENLELDSELELGLDLNDEYFIEHYGDINSPTHINSELEVVFVEKGAVNITCDGILETVNSGEAMLILPYRLHSFEPSEGASARVLMFSLSIVGDFHETYRTKSYESFKFVPDNGVKDFIYYSLDKCREQNDIFIIKALFYTLVSSFSTCNKGQLHEVNVGTDIAHRIMEYIYDHLGETLTLSQLATALGINKAAFSHIFEDYIGMPFKKFLNTLRMQKAMVLLEKGDRTVTEISYECGFGSLRTFNRVFASYMNCTPSDFRKKRKGIAVTKQ